MKWFSILTMCMCMCSYSMYDILSICILCMYVYEQAASSIPQGLSRDDWHVGTTRVFLRSNSHRLSLDRLRVGRLSTYIHRLQAFGRSFLEFLRVSSSSYSTISVCIYICMYTSMSAYVYVCMYESMYVSMYVCMYVSMYLCMYLPIYVCMYVSMYLSMYVCIYVCMYLCMYVSMYVSMYVCMYM